MPFSRDELLDVSEARCKGCFNTIDKLLEDAAHGCIRECSVKNDLFANGMIMQFVLQTYEKNGIETYVDEHQVRFTW